MHEKFHSRQLSSLYDTRVEAEQEEEEMMTMMMMMSLQSELFHFFKEPLFQY